VVDATFRPDAHIAALFEHAVDDIDDSPIAVVMHRRPLAWAPKPAHRGTNRAAPIAIEPNADAPMACAPVATAGKARADLGGIKFTDTPGRSVSASGRQSSEPSGSARAGLDA
jgi:hypothetical protein